MSEFRYEKICDEQLMDIVPLLITEQISNVIEEYKLNDFYVHYELLSLTEEELLKEIDLSHASQDGYYYQGSRCTYEEVKFLIKKNYKKLVLKIINKEDK